MITKLRIVDKLTGKENVIDLTKMEQLTLAYGAEDKKGKKILHVIITGE